MSGYDKLTMLTLLVNGGPLRQGQRNRKGIDLLENLKATPTKT